MTSELIPYSDLEQMAKKVVESRLFPVKNEAEAMALFLLCQAEGLHPMRALRMFDIIQGRPAIKPKALMASLTERGGRVEWMQNDDQACVGKFFGRACPDGVVVKFDVEDAKKAGLLNKPGPWQQYRADMLRHRCTGRGVDMVDPGAAFGLYSTPVVADFDETQRKAADYEVVGGALGEGVSVEGSPEPAAPAIESATGLSTAEHLAEAKKRRDAALAALVDGGPPHSDADAPPETFEQKLEREREKKFPKRPAGVPEFCECGMPISLHESVSGGVSYYECNARHASRHKMLEAGESKANIKEVLKGHFEVKYAGKADAAK